MTSILEALKELFADIHVKADHSVDFAISQDKEIWLDKANTEGFCRYASIWINKVFLDLSAIGPVTFVPAVFDAASCTKARG